MDLGGAAKAGVVDQHVDASELGGGLVHECPHTGIVGDVTGDAGHAELGGGLGESPFVTVRDHHPGTLFEAASCGG